MGKLRTGFKKQRASSVEYWMATAGYAIRDGFPKIAVRSLKTAIDVCEQQDPKSRRAIKHRRRWAWKFIMDLHRKGMLDDNDGSACFLAVKAAVERKDRA